MMPTSERRYFLSLRTRENHEKAERMAEGAKQTQNSKGNRTTRISGSQLKDRFNSGQIPLK